MTTGSDGQACAAVAKVAEVPVKTSKEFVFASFVRNPVLDLVLAGECSICLSIQGQDTRRTGLPSVEITH